MPIGVTLSVLDTGPLYASIDRNDSNYSRSAAVLRRRDLHFVIPALVVAETCYLVGKYLGAALEARFLATLARIRVVAPLPEEWSRIAALVEQYGNFPLGGTDASVIALAERFNTDVAVTLDSRHFSAVRPLHCPAFRLLPE